MMSYIIGALQAHHSPATIADLQRILDSGRCPILTDGHGRRYRLDAITPIHASLWSLGASVDIRFPSAELAAGLADGRLSLE